MWNGIVARHLVVGTLGVHGVEVVIDHLELDLVELLLPLQVYYVSFNCGGCRLNLVGALVAGRRGSGGSLGDLGKERPRCGGAQP